MNILNKIGSVIIAVGLTIGGWFGGTPPQNNLGASTSSSDVIALFSTTLATRITSTATSMTLTSATDKDGNTLASSTYGMIIDEGTASEELILADCTATTCTNLTRGLSVRTGTTTVSALKFEHRRGAEVKITDAPSLIFATNVFRGKQNVESLMNYNSDLAIASTSRAIPYASWVIGQTNTASTSAFQTILGQANTFLSTTTFSKGALTTTANDCQLGANTLTLCSKAYVDSVAVAGASNADETTKGIVEEATLAELNAGTATGATGAKLFMTPASFFSSSIKRTNFYGIASSTTTANFSTTTTLTTGDTLMIWANGNVLCAGGQADWSLFIKPPSNATTTLDTQTCGDGNGRNSSLTTMGMWTATSTGDYKIFTTQNVDDQTNIMFIKFAN